MASNAAVADERVGGCTVARVFVYFLRFLKVIAVLALLLDVVSYCLSMKGAVQSKRMSDYSKGFYVLSSIGFCLIAIFQVVGEFEPSWFTARARLMKYWAVRGFLIGWQGIQTISTAEVVGASVTDVNKDDFQIFADVIGWTLIVIGGLYILMATLCLKKLCGLKNPDEIHIRIISDERMDTFGSTIGVKGGGGGSSSTANVSPDALLVISNMAIALDVTSSRAWDTFKGTAGTEEARRIRHERFAAAQEAVRDRFEAADDINGYDAPLINNYSATASTPAGACVGATFSSVDTTASVNMDDDNPRARRMMARDAELEAQYYSQ